MISSLIFAWVRVRGDFILGLQMDSVSRSRTCRIGLIVLCRNEARQIRVTCFQEEHDPSNPVFAINGGLLVPGERERGLAGETDR